MSQRLSPETRSPESPSTLDPDTYAVEVERMRPRLRAVARRILGDRPDLDDVVQDAVLQGLVALERFRGDSKLSSWMHRIVTNAALMHLRRGRRRPELLLANPADEVAPRSPVAPASYDTPERVVLARSDIEHVLDAFAREPGASRDLIELACLQDLSLREVGESLGISANAAKTRLCRARRRLREAMQEAEGRRPSAVTAA